MNIIYWFFTLTGIVFWLLVIVFKFLPLKSKKETKECETYCSVCDKDTEHEIIGYGFNEELYCKTCNNNK